MYWYHPDHLGSSSFITGLDGEVTQNIEYFPSGETFVENHLNSYNTPYKFNGKEQDSETGYYYYGARYYNPRVSLWLNVDPLAEKYPNISPYVYCVNNPVRFIDPDGRDWYENKKTQDIMWKDSTKNIKGFKHWGNHHIVGQGNFIPGTKTYIERNYEFNKNGSISVRDNKLNELQRVENGNSVKGISGGVFTSSVTSVSGLAVQGNITFAPLITPGFTASFGYVKDSYGNGKFYYSYGKALGLAIGIGGDFIPIKTTNPNKLFNVKDFQGYGNSYSGGVGASVQYGGSTDTNTTFMQNISPNA